MSYRRRPPVTPFTFPLGERVLLALQFALAMGCIALILYWLISEALLVLAGNVP